MCEISEAMEPILRAQHAAMTAHGTERIWNDIKNDAAAERAGLCRCAECSAVFKVPILAQCPSCASSQIRRIDEQAETLQGLASSLSLIVRTIGDAQRHGWNAAERQAIEDCLPAARALLGKVSR